MTEIENLLIRKPLKIKVSGENFHFPQKCVFCCQDATTSFQSEAKTTLVIPGGNYKALEIRRKYNIPCCARHLVLHNSQNTALYFFGFSCIIPFILICIYAVFLRNIENPNLSDTFLYIGGTIFIMGNLAALILYLIKNKKLKSEFPEFSKYISLLPVSIGIVGSISYSGHDFARTPENVFIKQTNFQFHNHAYANLFSNENNHTIMK